MKKYTLIFLTLLILGCGNEDEYVNVYLDFFDTTVSVYDTVLVQAHVELGYVDSSSFRCYWKLDGKTEVFTRSLDTMLIMPGTDTIITCEFGVRDKKGIVDSARAYIGVFSDPPKVTLITGDTMFTPQELVPLTIEASDYHGYIVERAISVNGGSFIPLSSSDSLFSIPKSPTIFIARATDDDGIISYDTVRVWTPNDTTAPIIDSIGHTGFTFPGKFYAPENRTQAAMGKPFTMRAHVQPEENSILTYYWKIGKGAWSVESSVESSIDWNSDSLLTSEGWGELPTVTCSLRVEDDDGDKTYAALEVEVSPFSVTQFEDFPDTIRELYSCDVDKNGAMDLIVSSQNGPNIGTQLYVNSGTGLTKSEKQVEAHSFKSVSHLGEELLFAVLRDTIVQCTWSGDAFTYTPVDPLYTDGVPGVGKEVQFHCTDIDFDGDLDLVKIYLDDNGTVFPDFFWYYGDIYWYENDGKNNFVSHYVVQSHMYRGIAFTPKDSSGMAGLLVAGRLSSRYYTYDGSRYVDDSLIHVGSGKYRHGIISAQFTTQSSVDYLINSQTYLTQNMDESFLETTFDYKYNLSPFSSEIITVADCNGDGTAEIIANDNISSVSMNPSGENVLYLIDDVHADVQSHLTLAQLDCSTPHSAAIDVNNDGKSDFFVVVGTALLLFESNLQ